MKKLFLFLLLLLLLAGCATVTAETLPPSSEPRQSTAPATEAPVTEAPATEALWTSAMETPETEPAPEVDVGLDGTVMVLSGASLATPEDPKLRLTVRIPWTELTGAPAGRRCELCVTLDGEDCLLQKQLRVVPGTEESLNLCFSFARYQPDRVARIEAVLRYGEESLSETLEVELRNDPDEVYAAASGDRRPYSIDVLRNQNVVVVYGKDETGAYSEPVKIFLCSTGRATPTGNYWLGNKREWGALFGDVYGQYVSGITGNILFHSVPYARREKDSLKTEEYNKLGTSASMGCVRLAAADVKWIYDYCPTGTPVHIYNSDELPVEKPVLHPLNEEDPRSCWDPTDPDPENPWNRAAKGAELAASERPGATEEDFK